MTPRLALALCVVLCLSLFFCVAGYAAWQPLVQISTSFGRVYAISADSNDGTAWLADDNLGIAHIAPDGRLLSRTPGFGRTWGISANQADGTVWVADTNNDQVVHLQDNGDRTTTELLRIGGVSAPEGVSVNSTDGTVWIADTGNGEVVHLQDNGDGTATELLRATGFSEPFAISVNTADGTVWIGDTGSGDVVHLRDNGDGTATELVRSDYPSEPASVSVNPTDGTVWIADSLRSEVIHLQDNGDGTATTLAKSVAVAYPNAVSVNPNDGTCWAASTQYRQLLRLRDNGDGTMTELSSITPPKEPLAVSVDPADGSCWLGAYGNVAHYDASGAAIIRTPHLYGIAIRGIAVYAADGSAWIADGSGGAVIHVNRDGVEIARIDGYDEPIAVSVNQSDGTCWAAIHVSLDGMVVHLRDNGDGTITELARATGFKEPYDISVNSTDGTSWVANTVAGQILHLEDNGDGTMTELLRMGGFDWPMGLSVDPTDGTCWVANTSSWQVIHLQDNGDGTGTELLRLGNLNSPQSVAVDPSDGTCWAALRYGNSAVHLADNGDGTATLLATATGFSYPNAVAVNTADGTVWIADSSATWHVQDNGDGTTSTLSSYAHPATGGSAFHLAVDPVDGSCWVPDSNAEWIYHLGIETAPVADFSGSPTSGSTPLEVQFSDLSTGYPVSWQWDFGDGGTSTAQSPTHEYLTEGTFTVSLTVGNTAGQDTLTKLEYISTVIPTGSVVAAFDAAPTTGPAPLLVSFTDQSIGDVTSWLWDFGDSITSTDQNPIHEYLAAGSYTVALTVSDALGSDTLAKLDYITVTIPTGPVTAAFTAAPTLGSAPHTVNFTDQSTGDPTSWLWQFGDSSTSTDQHPSHDYLKPSYYAVSLTAGDGVASDVETKERYIWVSFPDAPVAAPAHWAAYEIIACATEGIVQGFPDGNYRPDEAITRDQMAVYLSRALAGGDEYVPTGPVTASFSDVPVGYWAYDHVEYARDQHVVMGYTPTTYEPTLVVSRAQMAVFLARAIAGDDQSVPAPSAGPTFSDVPEDFWAHRHIEYIAAAEVVGGYGGGLYQPMGPVTRDQMAVFVCRAFGLL